MAPSVLGKLLWLSLLSPRTHVKAAISGDATKLARSIQRQEEQEQRLEPISRYLRKDNKNAATAKSNVQQNAGDFDLAAIDSFMLMDDDTLTNNQFTSPPAISETSTPTTSRPTKNPTTKPTGTVIPADECDINEVRWTFILVTDDYAWETSWELKNDADEIIAFGPPAGINYSKRTRYVGKMCLATGEYVLTMKDQMGDGNCCQFGPGSFHVFLDGHLTLESDGSPYTSKDFPFLILPVITDTPSVSPRTEQPTEVPSTVFPTATRPSRKPTQSPTTSQVPTLSVTTNGLISKPTLAPIQPIIPASKPTELSNGKPSLSELPSVLPSIPTFDFSNIFPATEEPTPSPSDSPTVTRSVVPISPFSLFLLTAPGSDEVDVDELDSILSTHLLQHLQSSLPESSKTSKVDLVLNKISSIGRSLQSGADKMSQPERLEILVSGDVYFAGGEVPTTQQIDDVNQASFEGENGNLFIESLQTAEDSGLRSIEAISIPLSHQPRDGNMNENFLRTEEESPGSTHNALYVLIVVFSVGLMLVAVFVHRTRKEKMKAANEGNDNADCSVYNHGDLPQYIDVVPETNEEQTYDNKKSYIVGDQSRRSGFSASLCDAMNEDESQAPSTILSYNTTKSPPQIQFSEILMQPISENDEVVDIGLFCGMNEAHVATPTQATAPTQRQQMANVNWGVRPSDSEDTQSMNNLCST